MCQNFGAENFNTRFDVETDEPQFITKGHLYRAVVGDTIILPCKVKNLGSYILLWRRGAAVLTAANLMVTRDTRLQMVEGFNLQISDVKISDAGDYVCQIGDQEPHDQIHTLEILVPPSIRSVPDHGLVSARQGNTVNLECKSSGNPVPTVHWFRKVTRVVFRRKNSLLKGLHEARIFAFTRTLSFSSQAFKCACIRRIICSLVFREV